MSGDTEFSISRHADEWGDTYTYGCRECSGTGTATADIDHESDCSVARVYGTDYQPSMDDPSVTQFADTTAQVIGAIVRETAWTMNGMGGRESTVDEVERVVAELDGVRWTAQGSANRIAVGLGRTTPHGDFHLDDHRGVVLKIDPNVRFDAEYTPVSANTDELLTWETAVGTDTTQYFAEILAAAPDGMWLAMEYCIPVSLRVRSEMNDRDMVFDSGGETYINPLRGALAEAGWENPDYKHGNIGLNDNGTAVLLDYGTGPEYHPPDP